MESGGFVSSTGRAGNNYHGKPTLYVVLVCIIAASGGLIFGYDIGISGGVTSMEPFLKKFFPSVYHMERKDKSTNHYCKFESQTLSLFTSSLYLAALVASLFASTVTRKLGRKVSMFVGGLIFFAGAGVSAGAMNVAMLIIARILLGFGVGFVFQSVPLYISEMAPYKYRGAFSIAFQLTITLGIFFASLINYFTAKIEGDWGWRLSLGGAAVPAAIITIGAIFLPDTPNSLIERNETEEARTKLQRIRGTPDISEEFEALLAASEASRQVEKPWRNILQRKYRPHLTMAIFIPFFQQLTGINVIVFYAPVLFKAIGFGDNASLMAAVILGFVNYIATFVSIWLSDNWGRRKLFVEGGVQMFICQIVVAILIALKFGENGEATEMSKGYAIVVVLFICIFVSGFAWSWGPLGWLVPSEIFPLEIRSTAQSISVAVNMVFTFMVAQVFLTMLCYLKYALFFFFATWLFIMTMFIYDLLPETKGVPIEEMSRVWKEHWFWGRYIRD